MISKENFPLLVKNPGLVYLDNGATTQKPQVMIDALTDYYINSNANVGRGAYDLAHLSETILEQSRNTISSFFFARKKKLIFTSGATEALNLSAHMASKNLIKGDVVVVTVWDHHANLLPWIKIAQEKELTLKYIDKIEDIYNPETLNEDFWKNVKILAMPHVPNTIGNIFPVDKWVDEAKKRKVTTIIDGAQAVSSIKVNIEEIGADFYAFSAHKLYGPMGLGCLFFNEEKFNNAEPLLLGGGIIEDVKQQSYTLKDGWERFEAGTPDVANVYAFAETLKWLTEENWEDKLIEIKRINDELLKFVKDNYNLSVLNHAQYPHIAMTTVRFKAIHSHDIGTFLSNKSIAVRVGKHCAYPFHQSVGEKHSVRFSMGIYNTSEDIQKVKKEINNAIKYFME